MVNSESTDLILKYFPELSELQSKQFAQMPALYREWNERINVVSRKDVDNIALHHILHSLAIAKVCRFDPGARILDVGTGGGFPGIPLGVMFPDTEFTLVDSIGKKISVVEAVAAGLGLRNIRALKVRAENVDGKFDYVVSRAVTDMSAFIPWVWNKISKGKKGSLGSGVLYLKGGELAEELGRTGKKYTVYKISDFFGEEFFETKKVVYLPK